MLLLKPDMILQCKPSMCAKKIDHETLFFLSEKQRFLIKGAAMVSVIQHIDGRRSVADIAVALNGTVVLDEVLAILAKLADFLVEVKSNQAPVAQAFWELVQVDAARAMHNLASASVSIESVGKLDCSRLADMFRASGITVGESGRLRIILTDDYLNPELAGMCGKMPVMPVLLVKPNGVTPCIGPLIHPSLGSCITCLQYWVGVNRPVETMIAQLVDGQTSSLPLAMHEAGVQAVYGLVVANVANLMALQEDRIPLRNQVLALDLAEMGLSRHKVVRRPQCPVCGDPTHMQTRASRFPALQSVSNLHCTDGGYRKCDPGQTWNRYQHLISSITGPITYLHPLPKRHIGMRKVYAAGFMVRPPHIPRVNNFDQVCAGKGQTDEQARVSALCEALERFCGIYQGDEAITRASMRELGSAAIDYNLLQNFSDEQFNNRHLINAQTNDPRKQVPSRFDHDAVISWTCAWSLISRKMVYVPLDYCYSATPSAGSISADRCYGIHNPNGAAAGNCLEEAILQGFLELVERDATAIWWYNRIVRPAIDLASFADPFFDRLLADYAAQGWNLWVLDLTHDIGIPVCVAVAHQPGSERYAIGFGCHLKAQLAVQRALTEVNQLFEPDNDKSAPWDREQLGRAAFLFPAPGQAAIHVDSMGNWGGQDLQADVNFCAQAVARLGMDMLVVDKTRPDIGLNVVQVIVPGMRHFWPRLGAGRLYTVPVTLGWLPHASVEAELNRVPLFL